MTLLAVFDICKLNLRVLLKEHVNDPFSNCQARRQLWTFYTQQTDY